MARASRVGDTELPRKPDEGLATPPSSRQAPGLRRPTLHLCSIQMKNTEAVFRGAFAAEVIELSDHHGA